jgi:CRISPR-associated DxTHG motif protein
MNTDKKVPKVKNRALSPLPPNSVGATRRVAPTNSKLFWTRMNTDQAFAAFGREIDNLDTTHSLRFWGLLFLPVNPQSAFRNPQLFFIKGFG